MGFDEGAAGSATEATVGGGVLVTVVGGSVGLGVPASGVPGSGVTAGSAGSAAGCTVTTGMVVTAVGASPTATSNRIGAAAPSARRARAPGRKGVKSRV